MHTPAPWSIGKSENNGIYCVNAIQNGLTVEICEVWGDGDDGINLNGSALADARLIAAAPDLLEALKMSAEWMREKVEPAMSGRGDIYDSFKRDMAKIDAAIKKAGGV